MYPGLAQLPLTSAKTAVRKERDPLKLFHETTHGIIRQTAMWLSPLCTAVLLCVHSSLEVAQTITVDYTTLLCLGSTYTLRTVYWSNSLESVKQTKDTIAQTRDAPPNPRYHSKNKKKKSSMVD